jgi:hypothetical protein
MKTLFKAARACLITAAFITLLQDSVFAANEPIPDLNVTIQKSPDGKAMKTTTGKDGTFSFTNLEPGVYLVSVNLPQPKAKLSEKKTESVAKMTEEKGAEVSHVSFTIGTGAAAPVRIVFTKKGGSVAGNISHWPWINH